MPTRLFQDYNILMQSLLFLVFSIVSSSNILLATNTSTKLQSSNSSTFVSSKINSRSTSTASTNSSEFEVHEPKKQSLYIGGDTIPAPVKLVEAQTDILLSELSRRKTEFDDDPKKLIAFAKDVALSHWDFTKVSKIILGPYWKKASHENRRLFVNEFLRTILRYVVKAYGYYDDSLVKIVSYNWQQQKHGGWVKSIVRLPAGLKLAVDYRMYQNRKKQWKLIDVRVEGISLVQSKQSEYRELAHDESFESLLKMMMHKNQAVL